MVKQWKTTRKILLAVLAAVFLYSGLKLGMYIYDGYVTESLNKDLLREYNRLKTKEVGSGKTEDGIPSEDPADMANDVYEDRFRELLEINEDIVGWIKIPGTRIDYPVLQTDDNDFYLDHSVEKKKSSHGAIFMDYRNTWDEDNHTVIYGHNKKDGSMFQNLAKYKKASFYKDNAYIEYDSPEGSVKWQIFSVYIYKPGGTFHFSFDSREEYARYLEQVASNSLYDTGVQVSPEDKILTLITCTYEINNARLVICARRV